MKVDVESTVKGCPSPCPHAAVRVDYDVPCGFDGAAAVFVTVSCDHYPVCRIRTEREDGDD